MKLSRVMGTQWVKNTIKSQTLTSMLIIAFILSFLFSFFWGTGKKYKRESMKFHDIWIFKAFRWAGMQMVHIWTCLYTQYTGLTITGLSKQITYPFIWFVEVFRAKTTNRSANVLFPIHRFWPSRIHPPSTWYFQCKARLH